MRFHTVGLTADLGIFKSNVTDEIKKINIDAIFMKTLENLIKLFWKKSTAATKRYVIFNRPKKLVMTLSESFC